MAEQRTLYRSRTDQMVGGVCAGVAQYLGVDVTIVRIIAAVLLVFGWGSLGIAYLILWVVLPEEPAGGSTGTQTTAPAAAPVSTPTPVPAPPSAPVDTVDAGGWTGPGPSTTVEPEQPASQSTPEQPRQAVRESATASTDTYTSTYQWEMPSSEVIAKGMSNTGLFVGMMLILFGLLALVGKVVPEFSLWNLWPVLIIGGGLYSAVRPEQGTGRWDIDVFFSGLSTAFVGFVLLACTMDIVAWHMWMYFFKMWPLLVILGGIAVISSATKMRWIGALGSVGFMLLVAFAALLGMKDPSMLPFVLSDPFTESTELKKVFDEIFGHWAFRKEMM